MAALLGACATHRVTPEQLRIAAEAALARADARLLRGCYGCLIEARDGYAALVTGPLGGQAAARLFGAELLIVLREKELAIDTAASMTRLATVGAGLPADLDVPALLRLVELVPPNVGGTPDATYAAFVRDHLRTVRALDADVDALGASLLWAPMRTYLTLAVQCSDTGRPLLTGPRRWTDVGVVDTDSPLVAYRRALCRGAKGLFTLEDQRQTTPELTEAAYALARQTPMASEATLEDKALAYITVALADFSHAPAVTMLAASIQQNRGDCERALELYAETVRMSPRHEHAQLGRTACLSLLDRPQDAVAAASELIDWHSIDRRDAHYWRAYNLRKLERLGDARADSDQSKALGATLENATLAGIIEYEQDDLDVAMIDLNRAFALGLGGNCLAAFYQGLVHAKREHWADAGTRFEVSSGCYQRALTQDRARLATWRLRTDLEPDYQRVQAERLQKGIDDEESQRKTAALNGANCFVAVHDLSRAEPLLAVAAGDPALADEVGRLQARISDARRDPAPSR